MIQHANCLNKFSRKCSLVAFDAWNFHMIEKSCVFTIQCTYKNKADVNCET